jgi:superfamily I DNA and/or RNA helicase
MPLDPQDHFNRLLDLIDVERDAEKEENKRELDRWPVELRETMGKTVTRLHLEKQDVGVGGLPLIVLARAPAGEDLSPFHAMDSGDLVRVVFEDGPGALEGTLYDVEDYRVTVALNSELVEPPQGRAEIDLLGSDATHRRMRRALALARDAGGRLAQLRDVILGLRPPERGPERPVSFYDDGLNEFQKIAVTASLRAQDVALVHGPPGTGKTTVLVEIIRQAVHQGQKVLATAPSNIAVDNMLEKLLDGGVRVVRLGHPARTMDALRHATLMAQIAEHPEQKTIRDLDQEREQLSVQRFRARNRGNGLSADQDKIIKKEIRRLWREARALERDIGREIIQRAEVVLVTHGGMGKQLAQERFDLAALDEASQSTEPLSWIPIIHARKVVLAGDPLQLPPTLYSREAAEAGLKNTLMEKLQTQLPPAFQTLLRVQYRMNRTIMGFSSSQFYADQLIADPTVESHLACDLEGVTPTDLTQTPLVYVDTAGTGWTETWNELLDSRENEGEAGFIAKLWKVLEESGLQNPDVGVITPYSAQSKRLRPLLPRGVEVSSIDGFQGREKEVILLSLVRSNDKGEVGFLSDTRRMNVALTRARRLLVVVGDSATLARHPFYAAFLEYVDRHGEHRSAWEWM